MDGIIKTGLKMIKIYTEKSNLDFNEILKEINNNFYIIKAIEELENYETKIKSKLFNIVKLFNEDRDEKCILDEIVLFITNKLCHN